MQPKTISLFMPNLAGGGAERVTVNVANGLAARGHRVCLVLLEKTGPYARDVDRAVRLVSLEARSVRRGVVPLARHLRAEKPDVLLSALDHANIGALLARRLARVATRVVLTVHTTRSQATLHQRSLHHALVRVAIRQTYPWADAIVAVSKGAADDLVLSTGVPARLVRMIYNPVVTPRLLAYAREPLSHPWFAPGGPPTVVAVGSLTAAKDFPTLLRAAARLRQAIDFRLLILGEGGERSHLQEMAAELGLTDVVALPGFVDNPFAYLARSSMLVLSSVWEALPTVLIEALALGVPVVSTDCPSGPTEILHGGRYGRLVPVGDSEGLADAIRTGLAEPRLTVPPEVLQPFTLDAAIEHYEALIAELTGTPCC